MSTPLQPINYMQQRDLTPSEWWELYKKTKMDEWWELYKKTKMDEWWELYKKTKMDGEASVRECELEIKDLTIRAQKADRERDEAREALFDLSALVRRLFELFETVEVSDSESEFHPTVIRSCRVAHTNELAELLPRLKEAVSMTSAGTGLSGSDMP